jgi:hypothetical protein
MSENMREDFGDFGDEALLGRDEFLREQAELQAMDFEEHQAVLRELATEEEIDAPDCEDMDAPDNEDMDGDAESALASCGWGTDEDYNHYDYAEDGGF